MGPLRLDARTPGWKWADLLPILGPLISGLIAYAGVYKGLKYGAANTQRQISAAQQASDVSLWQKANEAEMAEIRSKLDSFFHPFMQLAQSNKQFAQDLRHRHGPEGYRLLLKLFDKEWTQSLSPGDRTLVDLICNNAGVLEGFIAEKAGVVDHHLLPYLSRASAHFRILQLAHARKLGDDASRFAAYVYPEQLDGVLAIEVERLKQRIETLRQNPGSRPPPRETLVIPPDLALRPWIDDPRQQPM